ncbi:MAG: hypothetical protein WBS19_17620 [Candidatus Korobacteraceae bacterium]
MAPIGAAAAAEWGSSGQGAGQMNEPSALAVEETTGRVYVADKANDRVDEFEANGTFVRAWGWGVSDGQAKFEVCTTTCQRGIGSGEAGALDEPDGIAIDQASKDMYVVDQRNERVDEFTADGEFVLMIGGGVNKTTGANTCSEKNLEEGDVCQAGRQGTGSGEFESLGEQNAVAVSTSGLVYVGDHQRVQWFGSTGAVEGAFPVSAAVEQVEAIAVTAGGKVCLTVNPFPIATQNSPASEVFCYSATGTLEHVVKLEEQPLHPATTVYVWLAADQSGHLFVDHYLQVNAEDVTTQSIAEYDEAGQELELFGPPGGEAASRTKEPGGLGLIESGGAATGVVLAFMPEDMIRSGALPEVGPGILEESATPGAAGCLKFMAVVDPEGASTGYKFAYGTATPPESTTVEATTAGHEFKPEAVSITQCGLKPETAYHFYAIAENANDVGKPVKGPEEPVQTGPALKIDGLWSAEVTEAGADLEAEINPAGEESEYQFAYAPAGSGLYTTMPSVSIDAGTTDMRVKARVSGLAADTAYDYRLVAHNSVGATEGKSTFTTQRAGAPPPLLDKRAWEQVSPPQKHSAAILLRGSGGTIESTPSGEKVTYYATTASEADPAGEPVPVEQQIVSTHFSSGWKSQDIATPTSQRPNIQTSLLSEYWLFSTDLDRAVVEAETTRFTALSQWAVAGQRTPYLRDEAKCPANTADLADLQATECFTPLLTDTGPFADVGGPWTNGRGPIDAVAGTPDLSHVVLKALGGQELRQGDGDLYEWDGGALAPISLTPGGVGCDGMVGVPGGFGDLGLNSREALAPDGSLAVWGGEGVCTGHLYVRDVGKSRTMQVDEVRGGSGAGNAEAVYQDASVGDEHIFFTDSQDLTKDSTGTQNGVGGATATSADLYEYAFDPSTDTGSLVDMAKPVNPGEAAGVQGVLGASENGSRVYAVAHGVLTSTDDAQGVVAQPGEDNLYLLERAGSSWGAQFIGTLSSLDERDWDTKVGDATARVSPDGRWVAFMSNQSLTGYDNHDRVSGAADEEVFLFNTASGLVCASCNPTGARPTGMEIPNTAQTARPLIDSEGQWDEGQWLSGVLPVRYAVGLSGEVGIYQPRYLSDGGRLFFDSTEALVPQDTNGTADVYEYEPPLNGEIAESDSCSASAATYSSAARGCIDLVSSGSASDESVFVEASESGDDVFFETASKLAGSDIDTGYDLYDAHSCGAGASWACAAPQPVSVASCETADGCKGGGASAAGGASALASEAVEGIGNLVVPSGMPATSGKSVPCPRGKRHRDGSCVKAGGRRKRRARSVSRGKFKRRPSVRGGR